MAVGKWRHPDERAAFCARQAIDSKPRRCRSYKGTKLKCKACTSKALVQDSFLLSKLYNEERSWVPGSWLPVSKGFAARSPDCGDPAIAANACETVGGGTGYRTAAGQA